MFPSQSQSPPQSDASSFLLGPGPPIITGDSERGPPGCNLFVFHLPNELTNWDLYLLFRKFGTIISVHTMINKNTGLSRGFGFVSFSKEDEAIVAVRSMDGFRLGKKRLKVQRKREHEGDDDGFDIAQDFEMSGYSGFSSGSVDGFSTPPSSFHSPRMRSAPLSPSSHPSAIQQVTPLRYMPSSNQGLFKQSNSMGVSVGGGGMTGGGMGGGAGNFESISPLNLGQHRGDHPMRGQGPGQGFPNQQSHDNQEAFPVRVSFDRETRLEGGRTSLSDSFESFPRGPPKSPGGNLPQLRGPGLGLDFAGAQRFQPSQMHYDPRGQLDFNARDDSQDSTRGLATGGIRGREGLGGLALHGIEMGRSGGLQGIGEMTGGNLFQEERRADSMAYSRGLDNMMTDNTGGSKAGVLSPHLALASLSRQSQSPFMQQQRHHQQLQQHRAMQGDFGGNALGQYNQLHTQQYQGQQHFQNDIGETENLINANRGSPSTIGSHSTEGKTEREDKISGHQDEEGDELFLEGTTDELHYIEEQQRLQQQDDQT